MHTNEKRIWAAAYAEALSRSRRIIPPNISAGSADVRRDWLINQAVQAARDASDAVALAEEASRLADERLGAGSVAAQHLQAMVGDE